MYMAIGKSHTKKLSYVLGFIWKIKIQPAYEENQFDTDHIIFKRIFWTFKPCIDGFKFCKSVVQVDGTCMGNIEKCYWSQLCKMTETTYYQLHSPS